MSLESAPVPPVAEDDHIRGEGPLVIVYGDYECPYCAAELAKLDGVALVFRHFPVVSKHPRSRRLAAAAEAAALQGRFWEMHDLLFGDQGHLDDPHLWQRAEELGLDLDRFERDRRADEVAARVERDFRSGIAAGVMRTPALFRL
ncbi:MAG TPA: DsbA family protein [Thermoleophilaceae bacterium]|nr:DsbA family protein [Thermoleophilaceae bacterium]